MYGGEVCNEDIQGIGVCGGEVCNEDIQGIGVGGGEVCNEDIQGIGVCGGEVCNEDTCSPILEQVLTATLQPSIGDVTVTVINPPTTPWRLNPIPSRGHPLRGFAITLIGHTTVGRTPLDE